MPQPQKYHGRLVGRTAIVTGAGTEGGGVGIGKAIALVLAGEGAFVCVVDRESDRAEDTRAAIERAGGQALAFVADVSRNNECARCVAATLDRSGRLDILVNNVGISKPITLDEPEDNGWNHIFDTNLKSAMLMTRHAVGPMKKVGNGSIVNITSIAGIRAHGTIGYGPSKAAMAAFAREIAIMHGRDGIRANSVAPGHMLTPHVEHVLPDHLRAIRRKVGPLGIEGDAWDVAHAVCFLCTDEARFITGVELAVDGGVTEIGPVPAHGLIMADD